MKLLRAISVVAVSIVVQIGDLSAGEIGELQVVDDKGRGLVSTVRLVPPEGQSSARYVGVTTQQGKLNMDPVVDCPQSHRITIEVPAGRFLGVEKDCSEIGNPHIEVLSSWGIMANLYNNYIAFEKADDFSSAAFVASEINARVKIVSLANLSGIKAEAEASQTDIAGSVAAMADVQLRAARSNPSEVLTNNDWSARTIMMVGRAFSVDRSMAFDPLQNRVVMTSQLSNILEGYQRENSIPVTGQVDYKTLQALSGRSLGSIAYQPITKL